MRMRWYINDASLQGQFSEGGAFEPVLRELLSARLRIQFLRSNLCTTRMLPERSVTHALNLRHVVQQSPDRNLRGQVLLWLDRAGPFMEDDRQHEADDYFEYSGLDVTDSGLGEGTRRAMRGELAATFSFVGGRINFAATPLQVEHGLPEQRLGLYSVENTWGVADLAEAALRQGPPIDSWTGLVEAARERYPGLLLPDAIFENPTLAREPFNGVIRDRALALLGQLNAYSLGRAPDGSEGPESRRVIETFFRGDRALFSGESPTNQREFAHDLTFPHPRQPGATIFAHWHGKIPHRFFRLHFEWPIPPKERQITIVYLGPKLTKN